MVPFISANSAPRTRSVTTASASPDHADTFLQQAARICAAIDRDAVERIATGLAATREAGGRLFVLGVGGSAANASHAVNDFRKLCGIEAYAPTDNVAELTARTNDEGWETVFAAWLRTSRAAKSDAVLVLSVGGGSAERNVSANLVHALDEAKRVGMRIFGIVGRDGGYTKKVGDEVIVVPTVSPARITPHTEAFPAVVWHGLVSHPELMVQETKWEGLARPKETARA
jgi:D-sedoheptulose 7-phosphate isomerase